MTKLQSLFYSLICNIVINLFIESISSVTGIDSFNLSLLVDLIPIIIYVFPLWLFFFSLLRTLPRWRQNLPHSEARFSLLSRNLL